MGARSDGYRREKRNGKFRWVIDFRYLDKDRREQRFRQRAKLQTAEGARSEAHERLKWVQEHGTPEPRPSAPTFAEFIDDQFRPLHLAVNCRAATVRRYDDLLKQGILERFGAMRVDASFLAPVRAYVAELNARRVQARPHVSFIRSVLRAACELGVLEKLPDLPPLPKAGKKLPDAPSHDHVQALLANATGWIRIAIALASYSGLRMGEVRALEVRDVDLTRAHIIVRRAFSDDVVITPKSGHERIVPLLPDLRDVLEVAMRRKLPHARIVVTESGATPGRAHVLTALKRLEAKLGVREWNFHSLRHFFVSELVRQGGSIEAIRLLAGHSKIDVTQRYAHAESSELRSTIALFGGNRVGTEARTLSQKP